MITCGVSYIVMKALATYSFTAYWIILMHVYIPVYWKSCGSPTHYCINLFQLKTISNQYVCDLSLCEQFNVYGPDQLQTVLEQLHIYIVGLTYTSMYHGFIFIIRTQPADLGLNVVE